MQHGDEMTARFPARDKNGRKYAAGTRLRYVVAAGRSGWEVVTTAKPATTPAPVATGFRMCRCCRRIALHTTAPHLGCDDCV